VKLETSASDATHSGHQVVIISSNALFSANKSEEAIMNICQDPLGYLHTSQGSIAPVNYRRQRFQHSVGPVFHLIIPSAANKTRNSTEIVQTATSRLPTQYLNHAHAHLNMAADIRQRLNSSTVGHTVSYSPYNIIRRL